MKAKRTDYNIPSFKQILEREKLLGEYIGTLEGIYANDIPNELKDKLNIKIEELKER